jgi:hypothetical protein
MSRFIHLLSSLSSRNSEANELSKMDNLDLKMISKWYIGPCKEQDHLIPFRACNFFHKLADYMVMTHEDSDNNRMQVIISFTCLLLIWLWLMKIVTTIECKLLSLSHACYLLPPSQNKCHSRFPSSQAVLTLTKYIQENINIYST